VRHLSHQFKMCYLYILIYIDSQRGGKCADGMALHQAQRTVLHMRVLLLLQRTIECCAGWFVAAGLCALLLLSVYNNDAVGICRRFETPWQHPTSVDHGNNAATKLHISCTPVLWLSCRP
jgi:hypothetical protein